MSLGVPRRPPSQVLPECYALSTATSRRKRRLGFVVAVLKCFADDQASPMGALIAYYGFFSLFPLLLVFVTVLGFVLNATQAASSDP